MKTAGTFKAKLVDHFLFKSKEKGTPGLALKFSYMAADGQMESIYRNFWLTDKAMEYCLDVLSDVFGWRDTDLSTLNGSGILNGHECEIVLDYEAYSDPLSGEPMKALKVKYVNAIGGGGRATTALDAQESKLIAAKLKAGVLSYRQKKGQKPEAPAPKAAGPGAEATGNKFVDDLPF